MKTAALYARVSTSNQEKEKTILSQIAEIEQKAQQEGNSINGKYKYVDDGWSGALLARPALDELRDAVKEKAFDILYVYDLGRLSRDFLNQLILKKEITEAGVRITSLHDINGDNPEAQMLQNVMGIYHDYERIKIAERFRRGKLYKAKNGILFGWQAPYGYKYVKGSEKGKGKFVINQKEADVIKKIFEWVGYEGLTIRKVIKRLYEEQIYPRKKKSNYWANSTLTRRLRDTTYIGTTYYNKTLSVKPEHPQNTQKYRKLSKSSRKYKNQDKWYAIEVPAIISKELFDAVQIQLEKNQLFSRKNRQHDYLLSGLIHCTCGRTRAGEGSNGQYYYRCSDRIIRYPEPRQCHHKGVNVGVIDPLVWTELANLLTKPDLIEEQYDRWVKKQSGQVTIPEEVKSQLQSKLNNLIAEDKRYLSAFGQGVITLDQYKEQTQDIKSQKKVLQGKLQSLAPEESKIHIILPDLDAVCDKMSTVLTNLSFDKKRRIVKNLIDDVTTDAETATIEGYIPLEIPENIENVGFKTEYRNYWFTQRRQIHPIQRPPQKNHRRCGKLPLLHDRTECRRRAGAG